MKKLLFVLCVLFVFTVPVLAQTEDAPEIVEWAEVEKTYSEEGLSGEFYEFDEIGIKVLFPSEMSQQELADGLKELGYVAYFRDDDYTKMATIMVINTFSSPADFLASRDDFEADAFYQINGIDAAVVKSPDPDPSRDSVIGILTGADGESIIIIQMNPGSDEEYSHLIEFILSSVQYLED